VITLTIQWISRRKPKRIVCREVAKTSLVRIERKAAERISIQFDRKIVGHLAQLETEVTNSSPEEIQDIDLTFTFGSATRILQTVVTVDPPNENYEFQVTRQATNSVVVHLPYLNSRKLHSQVVTATFICDGSIEKTGVSGGGVGWSVSYQPAFKKASDRRIIKTLAGVISAIFAMTALVALNTYRLDGEQFASYKHLQTQIQKGTFLTAEELQNQSTIYKIGAELTELNNMTMTQKMNSILLIGLMVILTILFVIFVILSVTKHPYYYEEPVKNPPKQRTGNKSAGKAKQIGKTTEDVAQSKDAVTRENEPSA